MASYCASTEVAGLEGGEMARGQLSSAQNAAVCGCGRRMEKSLQNGRNAILRLVLTAVLGPNIFVSIPFSRWYPPFPTKVLGSLAHIFMQ